jgi:hypothetical protein
LICPSPALDRHWLANMRPLAAAYAFVVVAIVLTACGRTYLGQPLDPKAPNVVPNAGPYPATIATHANPPDAMTGGVEGAVLLIRLTDGAGRRVLDRPFNWPKDEQQVPPGSYILEAYWMGCNGSCSTLSDAAPPFCKSEINAAPHARIEIEVSPSNFAPTTCAVTQ